MSRANFTSLQNFDYVYSIAVISIIIDHVSDSKSFTQVGIEMGYWLEDPVSIPDKVRDFLYSGASRLALGLRLRSMGTRSCFL
jgi:hypothetical protein